MESGVRDPELCTVISRAPKENNTENLRKKILTHPIRGLTL